MSYFHCFGKKLQCLCGVSCVQLACRVVVCFYRFVLLRLNSFWIQLGYFVSLSFLGFWVLKVLKPRTYDSFRPRNLDLFFTSVSAATVSSMSTVEMEVFSNSQLIVLTLLMFVGGEVFTSMVGLLFRKSRLLFRKSQLKRLAVTEAEKIASVRSDHDHLASVYQVELGVVVPKPDAENLESGNDVVLHSPNQTISLENTNFLKYKSIELLGFMVFGYLAAVHILGIASVSLYLALVSSARNVLRTKGLKLFTFSVFTTVSTFASCGFVPTNENMMVFSKNSLLLLILIPQVLLGNTLFPSCLRFSVWFLGKFFKREESRYLLKNTSDIGYLHLLPTQHSSLLIITVFGFILVQFTLFCSLEWNAGSLSGLNSYQKIIGVLFQTVNTRHTGETIVDLSIISPAILVLFVVMMYLPPYTSFLPVKHQEQHPQKRKGKLMENIIFSQLSYLVIFVISVCITERKKMKEDPLNFNVLNIVVEVISAYGNVGFSTGYSCKRQLNSSPNCQDKYYGFSGKWSDGGKVILIMVMFFGRLKKFNMNGGKAWILL